VERLPEKSGRIVYRPRQHTITGSPKSRHAARHFCDSRRAEARFLARRKELYEIKHPETRHGTAGAEAKHRGADDNLSFAADTAAKTGESERTVQRKVRRAEKIADGLV